jgi:hypothetical protein
MFSVLKLVSDPLCKGNRIRNRLSKVMFAKVMYSIIRIQFFKCIRNVFYECWNCAQRYK